MSKQTDVDAFVSTIRRRSRWQEFSPQDGYALCDFIKDLQAQLAAMKKTVDMCNDRAAIDNKRVCKLAVDNIAKDKVIEAHRWIPVGERLPEEGQVWICYKPTGYTYGGYYCPQHNLWQIFDPRGGWSDIDSKSPPTHWKPIILPEEG